MKYIVCIPQGGICNRMRTMSSVLDLAKTYTVPVKVLFFWLQYEGLNIKFSSIFCKFPATVISIKNKLIVKYLPSVLYKCSAFLNVEIVGNSSLQKQYLNQNLLVHAGVKIIPTHNFSYFVIPENLKKKLNERIDKKCIGIHIRRTDNAMSIKYSPTALFVKAMDEIIESNKKATFYLATDDKDEETFFLNKYGKDRIIVSCKRTLDRNKSDGIEDAIVDLANLSKCSIILGSYWSSFSETAAEWGNAEYRQIRIDSLA